MRIEYRFEDPVISALIKFGIDELSAEDVRRLNYRLIYEALGGVVRMDDAGSLIDYLSRWLFSLVKVTLGPPRGTGRHRGEWTKSEKMLSEEEVAEYSENNPPTPFMLDSGSYEEWSSPSGLARLRHPCFGEDLGIDQVPRQLSAGFHQIFPMILQLGLMRSGELVGIENPEVHLHPSLQLRIAEALCLHAKSGRRILIETHSDLIIRRIIRALLAEEIAQSQVQICFTRLELFESTESREGRFVPEVTIPFSCSKLEKIQFDGRGRIANWPEGFLGDDVKESQRLLDIMYGGAGREANDDEFS